MFKIVIQLYIYGIKIHTNYTLVWNKIYIISIYTKEKKILRTN